MLKEPLEDSELPLLVAKAKQGDTEAFGRVYDFFFLPIYRYTAFRAPQEMVEDLVSDIFIKAWEKLHQYKVQQGIPFGAWLFRIARHTVIDAYRTQRAFEEIPEDYADPDALNRADASLHSKDLLRVVRAAMDQLPKRYREILVLSYVAELPHSEVARVLKMTEGGVRILKFRALKKLESFLPPEFKKKA